ncbi:DUF2125 domain-containing protein [Pararhizobium antarcticum]|uniref:DUF2125 domain-containing protein n=1 Tax=Pararhizobium antarcticum TaxID=1798805 RepID=A0A657LNM4_9HYPH|nr:DUF2125 domain-containing protein [Pararhizobium antarcticum]OJF92287.1 hypothetical protein AX760_06095 [Pararhizobium antarcticum]OJF94832.1 hypothetical protein AX761_04210 [Rhizobium sp. 58]
MTATETAASPASRKIWQLAIGIVVFIALYTGAWFFAADQIKTRISAFLESGVAPGLSGECDSMDVRGFPFRIGLFCDTVRIDDTRRATSGVFGALRSAAQVYQPGHAIVELDGPAEIRVSPGLSMSADWALMHASLQANWQGLDRTSIASDKLAGTVLMTGTGESFGFAAEHSEIHMRRNGPDLDAAYSVTGLKISPAASQDLFPLITASLDLTVVDRANLLDTGSRQPDALYNNKGEVRNLTLDLGNDQVGTITGPFSVDGEGFISGEFSVTLKNIEGWRQNLTKAFPDEDTTILVNNIANMLTALADGKNESTVKLNVRDGTAFLAFIPIGVLPQL